MKKEKSKFYTKPLRQSTVGLVLTCVLCQSVAAYAFNKSGWHSDFQQLKDHVAAHYSHFDDKVKNGLDPFKINEMTEKALSSAKSEREALLAIVRFVASFRDGHFKIKNLHEKAPDLLGPEREYPFELKQTDESVHIKSISSESCKLKPGDVVTAYGMRPMDAAVKYWEGFYPAYNDLNRRDTALHYMTRGYLLTDNLRIAGVRGGKPIECKFKATPLDRQKANNSESNGQITAKSSPDEVCESLGIRKGDIESAVPLNDTNFNTNENSTFKTGVSDGVGYLYVPAFGTYGYRQTCEDEWKKYRTTFSGKCDEKCIWKFEYNTLYQRLTDDLESAIESLNKKNITKLVVDVTNNGGGSDWVDLVGRIIAPQTLRCQKISRLKSDNALRDFKEIRQSIASNLKGNFTEETKGALRQALANVNTLISEFPSDCNRKTYWTQEEFKPTCNVLTKSDLFACGYLPYIKPGLLNGVDIKQPVFKSSDFRYRETLFRGDIAILVNRNTSSSAEQFVSMLKDNIKTIRVIGEHTNSTGCGYYDGGNPIILNHSGLKINMSNCVRYRANGQNEVFGIEPDQKINWKEKRKFSLGDIFGEPYKG